MRAKKKDHLTFWQAANIALVLLLVYYPLTLYVNVPLTSGFWPKWIFVFMAFTNFAFLVPVLLVFDRLVELAEKKISLQLFSKFNITSFFFCVVLAVSAVTSSNLIHAATQPLFWLAVKPKNHIPVKPAPPRPKTDQNFKTWKRINNGLKFVTALSIIYLTLNRKANIRMKNMQVKADRLTKENALAQYQALKNQVSPHFLFNSLSILSSLVHVNPDLSEKFIDQLSRAYRYILEQKDNDTVLLKTELDFINAYAFLLKIRFESKFEMDIDIDEIITSSCGVAPFTLQLLVENAVKHNRMSILEPLVIRIHARDGHLRVSNKILHRTENENPPSTKIGLLNIIERYKVLTTRPVEIKTLNDYFIVEIPFL